MWPSPGWMPRSRTCLIDVQRDQPGRTPRLEARTCPSAVRNSATLDVTGGQVDSSGRLGRRCAPPPVSSRSRPSVVAKASRWREPWWAAAPSRDLVDRAPHRRWRRSGSPPLGHLGAGRARLATDQPFTEGERSAGRTPTSVPPGSTHSRSPGTARRPATGDGVGVGSGVASGVGVGLAVGSGVGSAVGSASGGGSGRSVTIDRDGRGRVLAAVPVGRQRRQCPAAGDQQGDRDHDRRERRRAPAMNRVGDGTAGGPPRTRSSGPGVVARTVGRRPRAARGPRPSRRRSVARSGSAARAHHDRVEREWDVAAQVARATAPAPTRASARPGGRRSTDGAPSGPRT